MKGSEFKKSQILNVLLIGKTKAGKTGALASLIRAGYKLWIIDLDNGCEALINHVKHECPDKLDNIDIEVCRDQFVTTDAGPMLKGAPRAFVKASKLTEKWSDGTVMGDLGPEHILVMDSLTHYGRAAYHWGESFVKTQAGKRPSDNRQIYGGAQRAMENVLATITHERYQTHVLCISHIRYITKKTYDAKGNVEEIPVEGIPSSLGEALGHQIPTYFNTYLLSQTQGSGRSLKRELHTVPTDMINCATTNPMIMEARYPINTGLATIFEKLLT